MNNDHNRLMPNFKYLIFILIGLPLIISCKAQDDSDITLEGKWKVVDWTYISHVGRSLDNDERAGMNEDVNDLILNFKVNQTFSSNKPKTFGFLEGKQFMLNDFNEVVIDNHYYPILIKEHNCFFLFSNVMFQLEKVENYRDSNLKLKSESIKVPDIEINHKAVNDVFTLNDLDKLPKLKRLEYDDSCGIDCLHSLFDSNIIYYIDFSKAAEDTSFLIEFIIDKTGQISNINTKAKYNVYKNNRRISSKETNEAQDIEKAIAASILDFQNLLSAGVKNGQNVNTKVNLELRLISK